MMSPSASLASKSLASASPTTNFSCENEAIAVLKKFYNDHNELSESKSHGIDHALAVFHHAERAIECFRNFEQNDGLGLQLTAMEYDEIRLAALMHDVDDHKYFHASPKALTLASSQSKSKSSKNGNRNLNQKQRYRYRSKYPNAVSLLSSLQIPDKSIDNILYMIDLVSCSQNGNTVPTSILATKSFHLLIPRWSDRLEAVGKIGVVRCYQYSLEKNRPLSNDIHSPKPQNVEELWSFVTKDRFENYRTAGGGRGGGEKTTTSTTADDMISHYYDKLLHVARPPKEIVQNRYLEEAAEQSSKELVEICLRYGRTGKVDIDYIKHLEQSLALK